MEGALGPAAAADLAVGAELGGLEDCVADPALLRRVDNPHIGDRLLFLELVDTLGGVSSSVEVVEHFHQGGVHFTAEAAWENGGHRAPVVEQVEAGEVRGGAQGCGDHQGQGNGELHL